MIYKSYIIEQSIKDLHNRISLFYGENLGLKSDFKKLIRSHYKTAEIISFNQEEILQNNNIFFNEINNISLFQKEKIFFIENTNDKALEIIFEIEEVDTDCQVFLFSEILDKKSKLRNYFEKSDKLATIPCYNDNEITIKKIIQNKLAGFIGLTPNNLNYITENSGLDRVKLNNELNKIIALFDDKKIDDEKLKKLLDPETNSNFNILKDFALMGEKVKTNKLLGTTVIEAEKNIYYLNLINNNVNRLLQVSNRDTTTSLESAINALKPPIFWKDKTNFSIQANKWGIDKIKKLQKKTYDTEIQLKSNSLINKNIIIKKLIVDICEMANA